MKAMVHKLRNGLLRLHRDDTGANMVEYILMIAAVALPLLGVLIWFWHDLSKWFGSIWENTKSNPSETNPSGL